MRPAKAHIFRVEIKRTSLEQLVKSLRQNFTQSIIAIIVIIAIRPIVDSHGIFIDVQKTLSMKMGFCSTAFGRML